MPSIIGHADLMNRSQTKNKKEDTTFSDVQYILNKNEDNVIDSIVEIMKYIYSNQNGVPFDDLLKEISKAIRTSDLPIKDRSRILYAISSDLKSTIDKIILGGR